MSAPHVFVLAVDGLRASALGAYGGATATPEIDRLASQATVYDWFLANAPELGRVYASLWGGAVESLKGANYSSALVADDPLVVRAPNAGLFDVIQELPLPRVESPASDLASTWLAEVFGELASVLNACKQQTATGEPLFVWMHTRGLMGAWDAPVSLIEESLDDEDPSIDASVDRAEGAVSADDPDAAFVAATRYAAQVQVLNACVGQLVEAIESEFKATPWRFALVGTRGYALGEHSVIGAGANLYAETLHTPLIVRGSDGVGALDRIATPNGPPSFVQRLLTGEPPPGGALLQSSSGGAAAVWRDEWRLVQPAASTAEAAAPQLFLKPDDRWEANDVASLMPAVVDELTALLPPAVDMVEPGDSK